MDHQYLEAESALKHLITPEDIVVVAPLNCGLGHATRCIPLIHLLSGYCSKVIIASDGDALSILRAEFPDIEFYVIPPYGIRYKYNNMMYNLLISLPSMISGIVAEGKAAKKIIQKTGANVIISDNRLGFRASGVTNYYMTHQINILYKQTTISKVASMLHQWFIRKFDVCLVPDFENHRSLCPALSHNPGIKKIFIGGALAARRAHGRRDRRIASSRTSFEFIPKARIEIVALDDMVGAIVSRQSLALPEPGTTAAERSSSGPSRRRFAFRPASRGTKLSSVRRARSWHQRRIDPERE